MCLRPSSPCIASSGSTAITLIARFFDLRNLPVPITVPPVPIAATKCVTWPRVWRQISGPVVSKCASGLASLLYWSGLK